MKNLKRLTRRHYLNTNVAETKKHFFKMIFLNVEQDVEIVYFDKICRFLNFKKS